ncbi:hypothetical protein ACN28S_63675 [Cystobacter fuscus]
MADGGCAGLYSVLMWLGIGVTLVLSTLLCRGSAGRHAPLVLLVGLATLPWLLGIAGTQEAMRRVLAALPEVGDATRWPCWPRAPARPW